MGVALELDEPELAPAPGEVAARPDEARHRGAGRAQVGPGGLWHAGGDTLHLLTPQDERTKTEAQKLLHGSELERKVVGGGVDQHGGSRQFAQRPRALATRPFAFRGAAPEHRSVCERRDPDESGPPFG